MKQTIYFLIVSVFALTLSCNQSSNNSSQEDSNNRDRRGNGNFDPEAMAERQIEQMRETLDLTNDQADQLHEIMMEGFENMRKMREEMRGDGGGFEGMREQFREMREQQDEKIKAILSDEQWEKYEVFQEEMRDRRRQGGFGGNR
jgi:Spy/CpxP family protein refolding chaperone